MAESEERRRPTVRRIVTGHSEQRKSKAIRDSIVESASQRSYSSSTTVWTSSGVPVPMDTEESGVDAGALHVSSGVPPNGTRFVVMDLYPGCQGGMHRTDTLDYVIVMEGEVEMVMDDCTVILKAGDVLVQQATNHAWANRTKKHARLGVVLIEAEPLDDSYPPSRKHAAATSKA